MDYINVIEKIHDPNLGIDPYNVSFFPLARRESVILVTTFQGQRPCISI
jgi:hypothetical protein